MLRVQIWTIRPLCYAVLHTSKPFETLYTRFDGFSTPVKSFWLICTTRRWDRGSVWGHTLFLSELNLLVSMRKPILPVAGDQSSIHGVNRVLSQKICECFLFANKNSLYVSFTGLRLTKTSPTLIDRTRLRTKGQSAGYPQAQIEITSNSFQRRAP